MLITVSSYAFPKKKFHFSLIFFFPLPNPPFWLSIPFPNPLF